MKYQRDWSRNAAAYLAASACLAVAATCLATEAVQGHLTADKVLVYHLAVAATGN